MPTPIIEATGPRRTFGNTALNGLNLTAPAGQVMAALSWAGNRAAPHAPPA